jgi:hypothetical protein
MERSSWTGPRCFNVLARREWDVDVWGSLWFLFGSAVVGAVLWFIYGMLALSAGSNCGGFFNWWDGGGQVDSIFAAAYVGVALLLLCLLFGALHASHPWLRMFGGFVAAYLVGLLVLWLISPVIWGPRHC